MGPLAHYRRLPSMISFVDDARTRGAKIETGGERLGEVGQLLRAHRDHQHLRRQHGDDHRALRPIAPCVPFKDVDEVLRRANSLPYGLSSYVFTTSTKNALATQNGIEAASSTSTTSGRRSPRRPFGGIKDSASAARAAPRPSTAT